MKIALINGSPKRGKSNSSNMLKRLEQLFEKEHEITNYNINKTTMEAELYIELCDTDVLIFAFPLYIDAIPSHLFRWMISFEEYIKKEKKKDIYVYMVINNGFYEGHQSRVAVQIMQNWCNRAGLQFGMAICQGAGEMMGFVENVPVGYGPLKNLGEAMESLRNHASKKETAESLFFSTNFAKFSWKFMATHFFWNKNAKRNGVKKREIKKRIDNRKA